MDGAIQINNDDSDPAQQLPKETGRIGWMLTDCNFAAD